MTFPRSVLPWRFLLPLLLWFAPRAALAEPLLPPLSETRVSLDGRPDALLLRRWHSPRHSHPRIRLSDPPTRAQRILLETSLGLTGGLLGGALGYFSLSSALTCEAPSGTFCRDVVLGTAALAGIGMALGVYAGGQLLQGDGDFVLGALLGVTLGFVGGALLSLPLGPSSALLTCPPLMLLGAITGYELTARGPAAPQVQPVVGFSSQGARVGVMGTF